MKKSLLLVNSLAKSRTLIVNFILLFLLIFGANVIFSQHFTYLTQTFHYSPDYAYRLLNTIGASGRQAHFNVLFADIAMVILYTGLLIGANYATFGKFVHNCALISVLTFCPFILALVQISEVLCLMGVLAHYPARLDMLVYVSNMLTMTKYGLSTICFLLPIIGLCGIIIKNMIRKRW